MNKPIINLIKKHYKKLALLLLLAPITHATSLEPLQYKQPNPQHQLPQDFLSKKYNLQNPLVFLLTISNYTKKKMTKDPK